MSTFSTFLREQRRSAALCGCGTRALLVLCGCTSSHTNVSSAGHTYSSQFNSSNSWNSHARAHKLTFHFTRPKARPHICGQLAHTHYTPIVRVPAAAQWAIKFTKVQEKNSWNQIKSKKFFSPFLAVLKLFPSSKIDFWPFLKLQKMDFGQTFFREIGRFDFFGLDFFKFSGSLCFFLI